MRKSNFTCWISNPCFRRSNPSSETKSSLLEIKPSLVSRDLDQAMTDWMDVFWLVLMSVFYLLDKLDRLTCDFTFQMPPKRLASLRIPHSRVTS